MDSRAESNEPPRFGPNSEIEWRVHAEDGRRLPTRISVWRRAPDGRYIEIPKVRIERADGALRITVAAASAFPTSGMWFVALHFGPADDPTDATQQDGAYVSETAIYFDGTSSDESL